MESDEKECPFCAETIKAKALKCKHCGEMLSGQLAAESAEPTGTPAAPHQAPLLAGTALDSEVLYSRENISVTARVIQIGTEAIQVANIDSVRTLEVAGVSPSVADKGCGGCIFALGLMAMATVFSALSMKSEPWVVATWAFLALGGTGWGVHLLKSPTKPTPAPTYTIQILHGLVPRDIARGWSRDDAIALEKAINEAFQGLRAAR